VDGVAAFATSILVATRAEMETALAAEEMKKSRRSMEVASLCFVACNAYNVRVDDRIEGVNADAVAANKARGATANLIVVVSLGYYDDVMNSVTNTYTIVGDTNTDSPSWRFCLARRAEPKLLK